MCELWHQSATRPSREPGERRRTRYAYALDAGDLHQPLDLVTAPSIVGADGSLPEFPPTVEATVPHPSPMDLVGRVGVDVLGRGGPETANGIGVVGARGDLDAVFVQHGADRLDPEPGPVRPDVVDQDPSLRSSSADAKNAEAIFRIPLARRSCAFSLRSRTSSASSFSLAGGVVPSPRSRRIQFRSVSCLIPQLADLDAGSALRRTALGPAPSLSRAMHPSSSIYRRSTLPWRAWHFIDEGVMVLHPQGL